MNMPEANLSVYFVTCCLHAESQGPEWASMPHVAQFYVALARRWDCELSRVEILPTFQCASWISVPLARADSGCKLGDRWIQFLSLRQSFRDQHSPPGFERAEIANNHGLRAQNLRTATSAVEARNSLSRPVCLQTSALRGFSTVLVSG